MPLDRRPQKIATELHRDWLCCAAAQCLTRIGKTTRRIEIVVAGTVLLVTLAALVAVKCATRVGVNSSRFNGLAQPFQLH